MKTPIGRTELRKVRLNTQFQWTNDFNEFNILDPKEWKKYLGEVLKLKNGNPLPDVTPDGEDMVYAVYVMGTSVEMNEYFNRKPTDGKLFLFPGYKMDDEGNIIERRDAKIYGRIR